jgi:hypothetical protein
MKYVDPRNARQGPKGSRPPNPSLKSDIGHHRLGNRRILRSKASGPRFHGRQWEAARFSRVSTSRVTDATAMTEPEIIDKQSLLSQACTEAKYCRRCKFFRNATQTVCGVGSGNAGIAEVAHPSPIIHMLIADVVLSKVARLDGVIATVDVIMRMNTLVDTQRNFGLQRFLR